MVPEAVLDFKDRLVELVGARKRDRSSAAENAAAVLRDLVLEGGLAPGQQVVENDLMPLLEVSRNTLREAFRLLTHEKLLEHKLNRGVFVRVLTAADVVDLFTVRRMVEVAGLDLADAAGVARMAAAVEYGETAAREGRWVDVGTANLRFHQAISALSGSSRIDELMRHVAAELRLGFHEMGEPRAFHESYLRRNREIVDTLAAGDTAAAQAQLRSYLDDAEAEMLAAFTEMGR
ncbi:GntR family transcriptional regulator [Actinokineospora sp. G85]|uniref:GntR family transcriptional regulator n=1 Tax=Actinokineospora sp. G85 TaxID=3406626 RepID=UPI003C760256